MIEWKIVYLSVAIHDLGALLGVDPGPEEGGLPRVNIVLGLARQLQLFPNEINMVFIWWQ